MEDALILLVEDNSDDVALAMRALRKSNVKVRVVVARDGVEALDYFFGRGQDAAEPRRLPDLILLDLKLPKVDGLEVLQRLRGHERTRFLPIVVMTTSKEERDIAGCYGLGANSYIRKPVDYTRFHEVMTQIGEYWLLVNETISERSAVG